MLDRSGEMAHSPFRRRFSNKLNISPTEVLLEQPAAEPLAATGCPASAERSIRFALHELRRLRQS
ncbi:MAG TPA: hypothetical protein VFX44_11310 [Solirubrobacterales bacterium]|nr:hypothetical protein [Solirubrobacterales bacterium]